MKTKSTIFVIVVLLLAVTVFFMMRNTVSAPSGNGVGSSTVSTTTNTTSNTSVADKTVSDGTILIAYSDKDFALATNAHRFLCIHIFHHVVRGLIIAFIIMEMRIRGQTSKVQEFVYKREKILQQRKHV
jgi:uncharacterized integral membrane protein